MRIKRFKCADTLGSRAQFGHDGAAHNGNALGAAFNEVLSNKAPLGGGIGGYKVPATLAFGVEVDRRNGGVVCVSSQIGLRSHYEHAGHLRASKITAIISRALLVSGATGNKQVVAAFACLCRGSGGNLQVEAVIEAREYQAKGLVAAACKHARALVGCVAQTVDCLVYLLNGLGAYLLGVIEYVGDGAQGYAGLASHVTDCHMCHKSSY